MPKATVITRNNRQDREWAERMLYRESLSQDRRNPLALLMQLAGGIVAGFLLFQAFFTVHRVDDDGMLPGLAPGDRALLLRHLAPEPGDVAAVYSARDDGTVNLYRVVAAGGDTVAMDNRGLTINGRRVNFGWKTISTDRRMLSPLFSSRDFMDPVTVPRGYFFMLYDNLDRAYDSRTRGPVNGEQVQGTLIYTW